MFEDVRIEARDAAGPGVIVVGMFQGEGLDAQTLKMDSGGVMKAAASRGEATGESGRLAEAFLPGVGKGAPARVLIVGLGKRDGFKPGAFRGAAAAVGRRLAQTKETRVSVRLGGVAASAGGGADLAECGRCFGEGLGLIAWNYDQLKGKGTDPVERTSLEVGSPDAEFTAGLRRGYALAEAANLCRDLSQTPPNIATPMWMAAQAQKLAREVGLSARVFQGKDLERERLTGLINVGRASENGPCMIRLEYRPGGKAAGRSGGKAGAAGAGKQENKGGKPVVLIGKTVTYDTGGLSLKINNGMVGMKRDKDGGCAVLGAMRAIATVVKPPFPVVALLASAENSISDEAYRPDDVLTYRNGVTVEVTNTDAEGRLVLADALCWACEQEDPRCIVDLATLTGGVITALGSTFAGMFCDDDALRGRVEAAAATSGERVWRLPFHREYRDMMKSPVADIVNSNPNRKAHAGQGAAFLSYFVKEGVPWCHLDIAGVHVAEADAGPFIKGPTGWGVRILADFIAAGA